LAKHASLLTLLNFGIIEVDNGEELMSIVINSGFAKVKENGINILVEGAVSIKGDNENEISNALDNAKQLLSDAGSSSVTVTNLIAKIEATAQKII
jgi:F-type H+-transporting ATPase subunit epsilon